MTELFAYPVVTMIVEERATPPRILLQKRIKEEPETLALLWELPQGRLRQGESLTECTSRELKEETGLEFISWNQEIRKSSIGGESLECVRATSVIETGRHSYLAICVICSAEGTLRPSSESCNPQWFSRDQVLQLISSASVFPLNVPMLLAYFGCRER